MKISEELFSGARVNVFCEEVSAVLLVYPIDTLRIGFAWPINLNEAEEFVVFALVKGGGPSA